MTNLDAKLRQQAADAQEAQRLVGSAVKITASWSPERALAALEAVNIVRMASKRHSEHITSMAMADDAGYRQAHQDLCVECSFISRWDALRAQEIVIE